MYQWAGRLEPDGLGGKEYTVIIMIIAFMIALAAAAGLGFQYGFRRGVRFAAQRAQEDAIVTAITRIAANKPQRLQSQLPWSSAIRGAARSMSCGRFEQEARPWPKRGARLCLLALSGSYQALIHDSPPSVILGRQHTVSRSPYTASSWNVWYRTR